MFLGQSRNLLGIYFHQRVILGAKVWPEGDAREEVSVRGIATGSSPRCRERLCICVGVGSAITPPKKTLVGSGGVSAPGGAHRASA